MPLAPFLRINVTDGTLMVLHFGRFVQIFNPMWAGVLIDCCVKQLEDAAQAEEARSAV
ncbi:hypothetical protein NBRC116601_29370 [Cognatishimia sp. WU-CL00825]|uniref:hypothetical protein n=1 Tax=Cognatishimia sp. WU-CL00825 TaxID=3127658 RepID=UPI0031087F08